MTLYVGNLPYENMKSWLQDMSIKSMAGQQIPDTVIPGQSKGTGTVEMPDKTRRQAAMRN